MGSEYGNQRDGHGQPIVEFRARQNIQKIASELIGLCKGLVADRALVNEEIGELQKWLEFNEGFSEFWPMSCLYSRVRDITADHMVTHDERADLMNTLSKLARGALAEDFGEDGASTTLPLDAVSEVPFNGREFCFTGRMMFGPRTRCAAITQAAGGVVVDSVRVKTLDYLVIGLVGSRDWLTSAYGTKIQRAVEHRDRGAKLRIVSERDWARSIPPA